MIVIPDYTQDNLLVVVVGFVVGIGGIGSSVVDLFGGLVTTGFSVLGFVPSQLIRKSAPVTLSKIKFDCG